MIPYMLENTVNDFGNLYRYLIELCSSIILCHNGAKYTAEALDALIKGLKEKGYEIVPISELIYKKDYHMDVTGKQIKDS